jgi:hypothetical protein
LCPATKRLSALAVAVEVEVEVEVEVAGYQRNGRINSSNPKIGTSQKAQTMQQLMTILKWIIENWNGVCGLN